MEVILKEDVLNLGHQGEIVKVADGYGRNYLLPRKLAIQATSTNKAVIEQMKAASVRRSAKLKGEAELLLQQLEKVALSFTRKTGDNDHLFGSVTAADITQALEAQGFQIDRKKVHLAEPLKSLGEFHVPVRLHREVTAHLKVTVSREAETA
jgi:large subunit ribosomal protein L9